MDTVCKWWHTCKVRKAYMRRSCLIALEQQRARCTCSVEWRPRPRGFEGSGASWSFPHVLLHTASKTSDQSQVSCARNDVCMLMISATEHVAFHSQCSILTGCRSSLHIPHGQTFLELWRRCPVALFTNLSLQETPILHQKFIHQNFIHQKFIPQKSFNPLVTSKNFFPMCTNLAEMVQHLLASSSPHVNKKRRVCQKPGETLQQQYTICWSSKKRWRQVEKLPKAWCTGPALETNWSLVTTHHSLCTFTESKGMGSRCCHRFGKKLRIM